GMFSTYGENQPPNYDIYFGGTAPSHPATIINTLLPSGVPLSDMGAYVKQPDAMDAQTVTASTTLNIASGIIFCNASSGAVTITLPPSAAQGRYSITKTDTSANACTVATAGTDTFVGGATTSALSSQGASHSYAGSGGGLYAIF
ncbi:hypothetical protein IMX07_03480, partial [bacterium]|nr:hypothetical protein [bacterium]